MVPWIIIGVVVWVVCGVLAYGINFAYCQRQWPATAEQDRSKDRQQSVVFGLLFGPVALLILLMMGNFRHGLKWR